LKAVKSISEQPRLAGQQPSCRGGVLRVTTRPLLSGQQAWLETSGRRLSGVEGVVVEQIRGTDPIAGVPSIRRRYVDFQRTGSALCRS